MTYTATIKKLLPGVLGQRLYAGIYSIVFGVYRLFFMHSLSDFNEAVLLHAPGYKTIRIKKKDVPLLEYFIKNEVTEFDLINIPSLARVQEYVSSRAYCGVFSGDRLVCVLWISLAGFHDVEYGCIVAQSSRGKGIGSVVLRGVEGYFLKKGKKLFVRIKGENIESRAFFKRNDFEIYDKKGAWLFLRKMG